MNAANSEFAGQLDSISNSKWYRGIEKLVDYLSIFKILFPIAFYTNFCQNENNDNQLSIFQILHLNSLFSYFQLIIIFHLELNQTSQIDFSD